ncbi:methyl-accepting chemotaxis protein [Catenovulum maritimum]|uniref:Chemotaxis protein n=1 Tax=Catenovulum maritimum TaxID=1513271 RepID=A0A0J8GPU6_9ALTE|nr:methyl-accepting chemotaxis protein [Catenovulum maritimum]KMT64825.1 hypothetical protein XM47_12305 [Catenovulum maritimum]
MYKSLEVDGLDWQPLLESLNNAYQTAISNTLADINATKNTLVEQAEKQLWYTLGWVAFILVGLLVVSFIILQSITKPLKNVVKSIIKLASNKDMSLQLPDEGSNELGELTRAFNSLVSSFNQALISISSHSNSMNNTTIEVDQAMTKSLKLSSNQLNATDSVAVAMNQMTATTQDVSNMAQQTAFAVQNAHNVSVQSAENANVSRNMMESLTKELGNTGEVVQNLNEEASQISNILNVIQSIAEQTNLLALNAAIEAARAGDMGRGFAVVADEVRSLAGRTQESTEQIRGQIENLLAGAEAASRNMNSLQNEGTKAIEVVLQSSAAFDKMESELNQIMAMAEQIATASEEQSSVSNEINERVTTIRDDSEMMAQQANLSLTSSHSLSEEGVELAKHIDQFQLTQ